MSQLDVDGRGADLIIKTISGGYRGSVRYQGRSYMKDNTPIDLIDWARGIVGTDIVIEFGKGDFTLEDELAVSNSRTVIRGQGMDVTELILGNGVNKDVIDVTASRYVNVKIHDLKLNGNTDNNTGGGDCINAYIASGAVPESMGWWLDIWNTRCYNADGKGLNVAMTDSPSSPQCRFHNIRSYDNDESPEIYFKNIYDSLYTCLWASSIYWDSNCTKSHISDIYVGGGGSMCLVDGDQIVVNNLRCDNTPNAQYALRVYGSGNTLNNVQISNKQHSTSQVGVHINGKANYLKLHYTDDGFAGGGSTWSYLVDEVAGSDYNLVDVIQPYTLNSVGISNMSGGSSVVNRLI